MYALKDSTTAHPPASNLVAIWARARRQYTPLAYPRMRALGALRLAIAIFLVGVGAVLASHGHDGWAVIPFAGAALNFLIGSLDTTAARYAPPRS
jgi:hypothetical protein